MCNLVTPIYILYIISQRKKGFKIREKSFSGFYIVDL